jgi:hypothetical protein
VVFELTHFIAGNHNGGQLQFGPDGLLYIAIGDRNMSTFAQDLSSPLGKLLRIDPRGSGPLQYSIPADNPFADGAGPNADEVYAYGLRNPFRFSFDRYTGDLIIGDVGEGQHEEIDFKPEGEGRGANFGWPCFEGTDTFSTSGPCAQPLTNHSPPVFQYRTGMGISGAAAVNAGYVIRDPALPSWAGRFEWTDTYGDLPGVRTMQLGPGFASGDATTGLTPDSYVFTSGQDACGHLYIGQAGSGGVVSRIEPAGGGPLACKTAPELTAKTTTVRNALKRGGIPAIVRCDVDCTATARGSVVALGRKKKGRIVEAAGVKGTPVTRRVQLGVPTTLKLGFTKKLRRSLRKLLRTRSLLSVRIVVSATGAGGGTATAAASGPRGKKPKKRKKK